MHIQQTVQQSLMALTLSVMIYGQVLYGGDFLICKDGIAKCEIIAGDELSRSEKMAVSELQKFIKEMSGAELSINSTSSVTPKIIIGIDNAVKLYPELNFSGLGDDGYIIKTHQSNLILAGSRIRGTLYAVYTLLDQFGYRWLSPDESSNIVPKLPTLVRKEIDLREIPSFKQRNIMMAGTTSAWCGRNKINKNGWGDIAEAYGGSFKTAGNQGHNVFKLLKLIDVEPTEEMLAFWKGKNGSDEGKRTKDQLCLTHPEVINGFVKALSEIAEENPGVPYLVIAPQDNWTYCQCDRCAKINAKAESNSGALVYSCNQVAKELAKKFPSLHVLTFAYQTTIKAPKNMSIEDNVIIGIAPIEANYMRPLAEAHVEVNKTVLTNFEEWSKLAKQLFVWDYVVNFSHYNAIFPNLDVLVPNIKFYRDKGVAYFMEQATGNSYDSEFADLKRWVMARAMWNPDADGQALITEFLNGYYAIAAPAIQKYIDAIHKASRTEIFPSRIYDHMDAPYFQAKYIIPAELAMREAEALAAGNPILEKRVRLVHLQIWYLIAHRMPGGNFWNEMEAGLGEKLDLVDIAEKVKLTDSECRGMRVSEWEPKEGWTAWVNWLQDYATQYTKGALPAPKDLKGQIITPEELKTTETAAERFKNLSPSDYHIIQACQMDSRAGLWKEYEDTSDGWIQNISTDGWTIRHYPSAGEEYKDDQNYDVYVRIKTGKKTEEKGRIFTFGERSGQISGTRNYPERDASLYNENSWYIIKLGSCINPGYFYFASHSKVMKSVELDCYFFVKKQQKSEAIINEK